MGSSISGCARSWIIRPAALGQTAQLAPFADENRSYVENSNPRGLEPQIPNFIFTIVFSDEQNRRKAG
jgi:hypothetical protein